MWGRGAVASLHFCVDDSSPYETGQTQALSLWPVLPDPTGSTAHYRSEPGSGANAAVQFDTRSTAVQQKAAQAGFEPLALLLSLSKCSITGAQCHSWLTQC